VRYIDITKVSRAMLGYPVLYAWWGCLVGYMDFTEGTKAMLG
jgi:hypothetical protein